MSKLILLNFIFLILTSEALTLNDEDTALGNVESVMEDHIPDWGDELCWSDYVGTELYEKHVAFAQSTQTDLFAQDIIVIIHNHRNISWKDKAIAIQRFCTTFSTQIPEEVENIRSLYRPKKKEVPTIEFSLNMNFNSFGIGGLEGPMEELVQQVLLPRAIEQHIRWSYGVRAVKGVLMYGPPGTGKSLIARNIGKMIPNASIKIINGPELSAQYVGQTEENIRKVFEPAIQNPDKFYVLIFDEIDAVGRARSNDSMGRHDDKVLTQLLTMIDGINQIDNILIIGITNRKDILDPALLRPGRLECHIAIGLPSESGRKEILDIYLKDLKEKDLAENIDTTMWAQVLKGYSGAKIEALIQHARRLALWRNFSIEDKIINLEISECTLLCPVTEDDMIEACAKM
jgi:SpoVK/Ycf46/Vps4 family AAA+-type ATPase